MAKGKVYGPERAFIQDPRSGLRVTRLTHYSTISMTLYFEMCSFTEDEKYVVLLSQRYAGRDAPWDLMRAKTDGTELVQMTDSDEVQGIVVSPAANAAFYRAGRELRKLDILSLHEETVADTPPAAVGNPFSLASVDACGKTYFASGVNEAGKGVLFKTDLATGKVETLFEGIELHHVHADPTGRMVFFGDFGYDEPRDYIVDADGGNPRRYQFNFAHSTWFGDTGKRQGCLLPPGAGIILRAENDDEVEFLTGGRYYWHSSASRDARWIVADTNWPQEGLYLLHVPTRTVSYLCDPQSAPSHPQWTHPHPLLSPGMKYVLFNSDMTGLGQVYLCELTEDFLQRASGAVSG